MNVRNITMMVVSMVIAVVIVTGVLVPVIADSMSDDSAVYTNTGQFQMKILSEEDYAEGTDIITVRGVPTDNLSGKLIFSENDVAFTEVEYNAENLPEIPLMIGMWAEDNAASYIYMDAIISEDAEISENVVEWGINGIDFDNNGFYIDGVALGSNFTLTITPAGNGYEFTYTNDRSEDEWFTTLAGPYARIAPVGELVYSQTPHIDEDSLIFVYDRFNPGDSFPEKTCQIGYIKTKDNLNGIYYKGSYHPDGNTYNAPQTVDATLDADNGVLNGIDTVWTWAESVTTEHTISDGFIVTKIVSSGGSSMPSSIATVLPIIPLVVVIGIIMAGIGMIRMKD